MLQPPPPGTVPTAEPSANDVLDSVRSALDGSGDAAWDEHIPSGRVERSARWAEMLGLDPAQVPPTLEAWRERLHPDDAARVLDEAARQARGEGGFLRSEYRLRCADGSYKWVLDRGRVLSWTPAGKPERVAGTLTDIDDYKRAQHELVALQAELEQRVAERTAELQMALDGLRDGEQRLRQIIDLVPNFIFAKDTEGRFVLVNRAVAEAYGTTVEDLLGRTDADFAKSAEEAEHFRRDDQQVLRSGQPKFIREETITDAQGRLRTLQTVKIPFRMLGTGLPAVLGVAVDISERRRVEAALQDLNDEAERRVRARTLELERSNRRLQEELAERRRMEGALRESEARHRALLDALPDAIFMLGADHQVLEAHLPATFLSYRPRDEQVGARATELLPSDLAKLYLEHAARLDETGQPQVFDYEVVTPWGPRWREARLARCGPDRRLVMVRDVTDEREADRLKSAFMATVSHELRTPLTAVRGAIGLLLGEVAGPLSDDARALLQVAQRNGERLLALINDILDAERLASSEVHLHREPLELGPLLADAVSVNRPYAEQFGVRLALESGGEDARISGDRHRLLQVLTNLLSNAAKFSPPGSLVTLRAARNTFGVRVEVGDEGPGVPGEFRARLFQRFAQADNSDARGRGGSGLGLSIAKTIVERHGGRIGYEPGPDGRGSRFFFELREQAEAARGS